MTVNGTQVCLSIKCRQDLHTKLIITATYLQTMNVSAVWLLGDCNRQKKKHLTS